MEPDDDICSLIANPEHKEAIDEQYINVVMKTEYGWKIITRSNTLKTEGDDFFREGDYRMAVNRYDNALQFLCDVIPLNEDEALLIERLTFSLNSNIAACWLKLNEFELAKNQCTSALKLNDRNIKLLYIRALASLSLGLVEEAYIDLQEAHKIEPTNLDVLFGLKRAEKVREAEFGKSRAGKGKEICQDSLHPCDGNMFVDSFSSEGKDRSLGQSMICSTSKFMEEVKVNPSPVSSDPKMNLPYINMEYKSDYGIVSPSSREAFMGCEKNPFICDTVTSRLFSPATQGDSSARKMFKRCSLRRDNRFFLKICLDDYEKLRRGSEIKYFSSHNMVVMTIRVLNRSLNDFQNGYIRSDSTPTSFVSNSFPSDDLYDLSGQGSEDFEWDEIVSKEMGINEDDASEIDVIEEVVEKPYISKPASMENTSATSNSAVPQECHQAPFRFTSRSKKCKRCKPRRRMSLFCRVHYNIKTGSKRKRIRALSSESYSPTWKKIAPDRTCHTSVFPVGIYSQGSLSSDYGSYLTRESSPSKELINSDVYELKISKDLIDDLERPLLPGLPSQSNEPVKKHAQEGFHLEGGSSVLDVSDQMEDNISIGQTLKRPLLTSHFGKEQLKHRTEEDLNNDPRFKAEDINIQEIGPTDRGSCLSLEVITGPARGLCCSVRSTDASKLPVTLGRVPPSDLVLKDSEVSGKHAMINWNSSKLKWELVDMGSLNGTLLNSKAVHHPDYGSRKWGEPKELVSGDVLTLGTTCQINVQITSLTESEIPFGVGIVSDPMSARRGGKKLPMEDVCYYQWPLPGTDQFGVFGICDGHGGALAAKSVSNIIPKMVATILSDPSRREKVLSLQDASDVLTDAISLTEACLNHYYEGCTATVLLVWGDGCGFFAQCANVGDSACVINIDEKQIKMTEDHRISNYSERQRINETGDPLKDGDTRLYGLNLGRMLGDKFLKEQDARFSSKPYISQVIHIDRASEAFALLASDGLWDVISVRKAVQLVLQAKERYSTDSKDSAEKIANFLLNEAKTLRTKDNTSVVYIDFNIAFRTSCKYGS